MTPNSPVRDRRIVGTRPLMAPQALRQDHPLTEQGEAVVIGSRRAVADVLDGHDDRLLVVVGPCSVHDPMAALDYASRLIPVARTLEDDLLIVMRVYFEKPRTTTGWKGLINDPDLDGGFRVDQGLRTARALLLDIVGSGLPVGCEFLDPIIPQYLADTVTWGAIGARTAESQIHRQLASGLSMPVGIKNSTTGDVQVAVDAIRAAATGQVFIGVDDDGAAAILTTAGNPDCHVVLRGGAAGPNCDTAECDRRPRPAVGRCPPPSPRYRRQSRQQRQGSRASAGSGPTNCPPGWPPVSPASSVSCSKASWWPAARSCLSVGPPP